MSDIVIKAENLGEISDRASTQSSVVYAASGCPYGNSSEHVA
jgi:hypothetical protein